MSKKKKKKNKIEEVTETVEQTSSELEIAQVNENVENNEQSVELENTEINENINDEQAVELDVSTKQEEVEKIEEKPTVQEESKEEEVRQPISTKTYSATVDKLVGEVKLFNDDDADLEIDKKRRVWPIILILILLVGGAFGIWYFLLNDNNDLGKTKEEEKEVAEENKNQNIEYRYEEKEDGIEFYNGTELVDTYSCEGCKAYVYGRYEYFSSMPTVIAIQDGEKIFLYDYTLKKVVSDNYTQLQNIKSDGETILFIVTTELGTVGIMNIAGEVIIPTDYEALGYSISGGDVSDYDYKKDIITAKKDGYWGAINFKGEEIIPFEYEDIYYNGYNGIAVCVEGYWYLHNLNNNRLIETGYDMIIPIKSYVFTSVDKVFYVLNYKGEPIIEKEIPTFLDTFRSRNESVTPVFKIEEDGTVVNIYIMKNDVEYNQYKFNTVNGELTEIIQ